MIDSSHRVRIEGHLLHRMVFEPEASTAVRASAIFYHGQGDYAERYIDVLHVFTRRGIRCIITELPGHGHSPGRRGHCGDEALLDAVVRDTLMEIGDLPYGVAGHSMGGLLALRHLIHSGRGHYPQPAFAWLSSTLLSPGIRHPGWYKAAMRFLAMIMPGLTITTGVTPQMCRVNPHAPEKPLPVPKHELWHRRVSLRWAAALMDFAQLARDHVSDVSETVPIIYTQGAEDPVCPAETARAFFATMPGENKSYHEFEGMLHEPFNGVGNEQLFTALEAWLDTLAVSK